MTPTKEQTNDYMKNKKVIQKLYDALQEVKVMISCQFYGDGTMEKISRGYAETIVKIAAQAIKYKEKLERKSDDAK